MQFITTDENGLAATTKDENAAANGWSKLEGWMLRWRTAPHRA